MVVFLSQAFQSAPDAARRGFESMPAIKLRIAESKSYDLDGSDPADAVALLIFSTRLQQTWLVASARRLYCVLDDIGDLEPRSQWSMPLEEIVNADGTLRINLRERLKSERSGLVDFGEAHKDWLFSRKLFEVTPIAESIARLASLARRKTPQAA